jgi:Zn-dependent M16 (insulinase) family peptidase
VREVRATPEKQMADITGGDIPILGATALICVHAKHHCRFVALPAPEDPLNTFGVALRMIPSDNSGVSHVLEHLTLWWGSDAYLIRGLIEE